MPLKSISTKVLAKKMREKMTHLSRWDSTSTRCVVFHRISLVVFRTRCKYLALCQTNLWFVNDFFFLCGCVRGLLAVATFVNVTLEKSVKLKHEPISSTLLWWSTMHLFTFVSEVAFTYQVKILWLVMYLTQQNLTAKKMLFSLKKEKCTDP